MPKPRLICRKCSPRYIFQQAIFNLMLRMFMVETRLKKMSRGAIQPELSEVFVKKANGIEIYKKLLDFLIKHRHHKDL